MKNSNLLKIKNKLKKLYSYFKHDNILVVCENKTNAPFAYVISDIENYPDRLLVSLAVDYPTSLNVAQLILIARSVQKVSLSEPFYVSMNNGKTHLGKDAFYQWDLEMLGKIKATSNELH